MASFWIWGAQTDTCLNLLWPGPTNEEIALTPYGVDLNPRLLQKAMRRFRDQPDHFWVANAWAWLPPKKFSLGLRVYGILVPIEYPTATGSCTCSKPCCCKQRGADFRRIWQQIGRSSERRHCGCLAGRRSASFRHISRRRITKRWTSYTLRLDQSLPLAGGVVKSDP